MKTLLRPFFLIVVLATATVFSGCKDKIEPGNTPAKAKGSTDAAIAVARVSEGAEQYDAVATVMARIFAELSSKTMGMVREVRVEEGDRVKEGDVLIVIDASEATARLEQAVAGLEESRRAALSAESARDAAKAAAELSETTFGRYRRLLEEESATQQEFDEVEMRRRQAKAALDQTEAMLAGARNRVDQAEAFVRGATVQKNDTLIQAPYAGRITRKRVHAGDLAVPGTPLLSIEKGEGYRAEVNLPERLNRKISSGQRVSVRIPALGAEPVEGKISQIKPSTDARSRSFTIKVDLPNLEGLRSGMFARIAFPTGTRGVLSVPKKAILHQGQLSGIFVLDADDVARFRLVRTGRESGEFVEILSGLKEGARYIVEPPPTLEDGMKVESRS